MGLDDKFTKRLEMLQGELTQKQFAANIGIPLNTYTNWLSGSRKPSAEAILNICTQLDVSADWLLGISNDKNKITATNSNVASPHGAVNVSTGGDPSQISDIYKEVIAHERKTNEFLQREVDRLTSLLESRKD